MIQLVEGRKHQVIKRDGRYENYSPEKMYQVLLWACEGSEVLAKELLNDIDIKVYDKISIQKLFDEVIQTAANKISDLFVLLICGLTTIFTNFSSEKDSDKAEKISVIFFNDSRSELVVKAFMYFFAMSSSI